MYVCVCVCVCVCLRMCVCVCLNYVLFFYLFCLFLIAYQTSWIISYQSYSCRRRVVLLFNLLLGNGYKGLHTFPKTCLEQ